MFQNKNKSLEIILFTVLSIITMIFFVHIVRISNNLKTQNEELHKITLIEEKRADMGDKIVLKGHFDNEIRKNERIFLYSHQINVEIKKNNEKIYSSKNNKLYPSIMYSIGSQWLDFSSPGFSKDDDIEIILENDYFTSSDDAYNLLLDNLYYGEKDRLFHKEINQNIFKILGGLLILVLGVAFVITTVALKAMGADIQNGYIACGLLLINGALCIIINYDYITLFFSNVFLVNIIDYFIQMLTCEFLIIYLRTFIKTPKIYRLVTVFIYFWTVCITGYLVLQSFGIFDIIQSSHILAAIALVLIVLTLITIVIEYKKYNSLYTKLILQSGVVLGISAAIELINFYITHIYWFLVFEFGLFVFTLIQFFIMLSYAKESMMKAQQTEKLEREVMKMKIDIMISQIQPHFIFNALLAIKQLCISFPEKAAEAIDHFSMFLRGNIDSIGTDKCISFIEELNHVKNYLYVEKLRYEERLEVVYNIKTKDFLIPPLSLQPIVENAVRYGISKKRKGGTLLIETKEEIHNIVVIVKDNGAGFDVNKKFIDGKRHVGIENVRNRLENQCGGKLIIKSEENRGTEVNIVLPKVVKN